MYNAEKTVESAMESVQRQTYSNLEIICIDDGSDDATFSIVKRRAKLDKRIKLHSHEHKGITQTLNRAIELSHGKYLARMDADDITSLDRIEKQVSYMESNPDIVASGSALVEFGEKGNSKFCVRKLLNREVFMFYQLRGTAICHPTLIIRREVLLENNIRYEEGYTHAEDYKFLFDLSQVGKLVNIPDVLHYYRRHANQVSAKYSEQQKRAASKIRAEIYKFLCEKFELNLATDNPRELRRKIPRHHDAIWPFLGHTITQNENLTILRKLRLVLFTHLRLTAKPRMILRILKKAVSNRLYRYFKYH